MKKKLIVLSILFIGIIFLAGCSLRPVATNQPTGETTDWKMYTNPTFGYSIKYPTTWTEKQDNVLEAGGSEDIKNMIIGFYNGATLMLRITTDYKTKAGDPSLLSLASEIPAPKDKTTISDAVIYKIGNLDGYRRLVTMSADSGFLSGLEYITKDSNYIYHFRTFEKTESTEIVNMLKTFIVNQNQPTTTDWKSYQNEKYGFGLTFNDLWKGYKVIEKNPADSSDKEATTYLYLCVPTQSTKWTDIEPGIFCPISITVVEADKWEQYQKDNDPMVPTYINKNASFVFAYSTAQDRPDDGSAVMGDYKNIINSFKPGISNLNEPLSYSTTGVSVSFSKTTSLFDQTAEQLESTAKHCGGVNGAPHDIDYYNQLVSKFSGATKIEYNFKYTGATTFYQPDTFVVTLLPNKMGYASLEQFKKDFDICPPEGGGDAYPIMLNSNWILFKNGCLHGADKNTLNSGCKKIEDIVEPTLKLN